MTAFVVRRILQMIPLLLGISVVVFTLIQLAPGGPEGVLLNAGRVVDPQVLEAYRARIGVDQPAPVQYVRWLGGVLQGDLGVSFRTSRPVAEEILQRLPATLELLFAAVALALLLALGLGVLGAFRAGTRLDHALTGVAYAGLAMPVFWISLILQLVVAVRLGWLPVSGRGGADGGWSAAYLILPAVALAVPYTAGWSRYLRASLVEALASEYVRVARAKGLPEVVVVGRHALRNALLPLVSIVALDVAALFSGAVVTEMVFAWPGIGRLFVESMYARDYPVLMGLLLIGSGMVVLLNLAADVAYGLLDPRVRHE